MNAASGSTGAGNIAGYAQAAYTSTKFYKEIGPCAYRNWKSDSECYKLHGYDRSFAFTFGCAELDKQGFVVDFGGLKEVKRQLEYWFDHTVILQSDDPMVKTFRKLEGLGHLVLRTFPLISCEGLAQWVGEYVDYELQKKDKGRSWVITCEMIEAEKNSSLYNPRRDHDRLSFPELQAISREMEADNNVDMI